MIYFVKGMKYAQKNLTPPPWPLDGVTFCDWLPDKPRYMHGSTYQKHLIRFLRYRKRHEVRLLSDMMRMIGPKGRAKINALMRE